MFEKNLFSLFVFTALVYLQLSVVATGFVSDEISGKTMGTTYSIKFALAVESPDREAKLKEIKTAVDSRLQAINQEMSTYISDSVISRFNQSESIDPFPISEEFAVVVKQANEISQLTNGRFDITVGPLVNFWGFGNVESQRDTLPSEPELEAVLKRIGFEKLTVDQDTLTISKSVADLELDLSAIAKGYAVDQVAMLISKTTENYMVEIGGEIFAAGVNPETKKPWAIAIEDPSSSPFPSSRKALAKLNLSSQALATSGDYRNIVFIEGGSFQHTMNPTTGYPVDHGVKSVSVIADNCMKADALATSLMVYPPEALKEFASSNQLSVLMVHVVNGEPVVWASPEFTGELLVSEPKVSADLSPKSTGTMTMVFATLIVFGLAIVGMAVGVIISNKQLKGSCGGLSAMAGKSEDASPCSLCTKPVSDCPKKQDEVKQDSGGDIE